MRRLIAIAFFWLSGCATSELVAKGRYLEACRRDDGVLLGHLVNAEPRAPFFVAHRVGTVLVLEEQPAAVGARRLTGPTFPTWYEEKDPARALAFLEGRPPPPRQEPESTRRSGLAMLGGLIGTVTGLLPAASVFLRRDLVSPALSPTTDGVSAETLEGPLLVGGKRVRVYESWEGSTSRRPGLEFKASWTFGEGDDRCSIEAHISWSVPVTWTMEDALRLPKHGFNCSPAPDRCFSFSTEAR